MQFSTFVNTNGIVNLYVKFELLLTKDGSFTLFAPELNETFHSTHGAIQEAMHVFIGNGLQYFKNNSDLNILEIGFGTGLNALLTYLSADRQLYRLNYTSIETNPLKQEIVKQLNYISVLNNPQAAFIFEQLHLVPWDVVNNINEFFVFQKIHQKIQEISLETHAFDLIYYDAFGPRAQTEMWTKELFSKMFECLKVGGILVTYCAKGQVKRDLRSVGFMVETLPGPPGKREMTRAIKVDSI